MNNQNNKQAVKYREADADDVRDINGLFQEHIRDNLEYISHGEMQMGIALDGDNLSADAGDKWSGYISALIEQRQGVVLVAERRDVIIGFVIMQITDDGDDPFGVLNDILVHELDRGEGIGKSLLERGIDWLRARGIGNCYLESGRRNHFAHEFFARQGFRHISSTFHRFINDNPGFDFPEENDE